MYCGCFLVLTFGREKMISHELHSIVAHEQLPVLSDADVMFSPVYIYGDKGLLQVMREDTNLLIRFQCFGRNRTGVQGG